MYLALRTLYNNSAWIYTLFYLLKAEHGTGRGTATGGYGTAVERLARDGVVVLRRWNGVATRPRRAHEKEAKRLSGGAQRSGRTRSTAKTRQETAAQTTAEHGSAGH